MAWVNIKSLFDAASQDYDRTRRQYIPCFDEFYGAALSLIPYSTNAEFRVLDLGAGTGLLAGLVAEAFPWAALTLADISDVMLGKAKKRFADRTDIEYQILDFIHTPMEGQYDIVVSGLALHHTPQEQLKGVFDKIFGVLARGGYFINADQTLGTTPENEERYEQAWRNGAIANGCSARDLEIAIERMRADKTATLSDQLDWMRQCGFKHVDCWYKNYRFAVYSGQK